MLINKRRRWGVWIGSAAVLGGLIYVVAHFLIANGEAFATASAFVRSSPEVVRVAGSVQDISLSWHGGEIEASGDSGHARLSVNVTGARASPRAYVELVKRGVWEVTYARLLPESGESIVLKDAKQ